MIENAANLIETKLRLLGATAIEDQLQDQVCMIFIFLYSFLKVNYWKKIHNVVGTRNNTGSFTGWH